MNSFISSSWYRSALKYKRNPKFLPWLLTPAASPTSPLHGIIQPLMVSKCCQILLKNPSMPAITSDTSSHSNITSPIWALSLDLIWNLNVLDILITGQRLWQKLSPVVSICSRFISGKGKGGYLTSTADPPSKSDPNPTRNLGIGWSTSWNWK